MYFEALLRAIFKLFRSSAFVESVGMAKAQQCSDLGCWQRILGHGGLPMNDYSAQAC